MIQSKLDSNYAGSHKASLHKERSFFPSFVLTFSCSYLNRVYIGLRKLTETNWNGLFWKKRESLKKKVFNWSFFLTKAHNYWKSSLPQHMNSLWECFLVFFFFLNDWINIWHSGGILSLNRLFTKVWILVCTEVMRVEETSWDRDILSSTPIIWCLTQKF